MSIKKYNVIDEPKTRRKRGVCLYKKRLIEDLLNEFKKSRFALLVEGAKGTGKTTSCKGLTEHHFHLDHPVELEMVEGSQMKVLFDRKGDVLIDEWQLYPDVWHAVKRKVDENSLQGTLFLTGSSPSLQPQIHSGSGRILRFKMRPLSIQEREIESPQLFLSEMLNLETEGDFFFQTDITLENYLDEIYASGFPGIRDESELFRKKSLESYVDNIVHHDLGENSIVVRKPAAMKAWLRTYSATIGTTTSAKTIADAAFNDGEESLAAGTLQHYREVLKGIGITEEVPAWLPIGQLFSNLGKIPKHFLVDPALSVNLLSVSKKNLMMGRRLPKTIGKLNKTFLGQLFEALVFQSLAVYCDINGAALSHLRLRAGEKEIDFIIQKEDVLIAVEVKSKAVISDKDVAVLNWFESKIKDEYDVIKLVINVGQNAYMRKDGVIVCPLALLGC